MATEKLQILQMVQEGKITAEEGLKLMEALEPSKIVVDEAPAATGGHAGWVRIRVTDQKSGKKKVNVNIPLGLIDIASRFVKPEQIEGVDLKEVVRIIKEGARGKIVEVNDDDEGVNVEIIVE